MELQVPWGISAMEALGRCKTRSTRFPCTRDPLSTVLTHLSESTGSKAAIEEALHALAWMHRVAGLPSVGESPLVQETAQGLRRLLAKPNKRKEPITAEMLKSMVESVGLTPSLTEVRLLAVCLLAFAGFMRCDELVKLRCKDIVYNDEGMVVNICSSKTDQLREGASLVIARSRAVTCPVDMMQRYCSVAKICVMSPKNHQSTPVTCPHYYT